MQVINIIIKYLFTLGLDTTNHPQLANSSGRGFYCVSSMLQLSAPNHRAGLGATKTFGARSVTSRKIVPGSLQKKLGLTSELSAHYTLGRQKIVGGDSRGISKRSTRSPCVARFNDITKQVLYRPGTLIQDHGC